MKRLLAIALIALALANPAVANVAADVFPEDPFLLVTLTPPVNIPVPWDSRADDTRFNDYCVRGLDVALVYSSCPSVYGLSVGCVMRARVDMKGLQCGAWGIAETGYGAQICAYNDAGKLYGVQIGLVNVCEELYGVQIGLVNVNLKGWCPVLPLLNMRF